jgi:hypothetical protein
MKKLVVPLLAAVLTACPSSQNPFLASFVGVAQGEAAFFSSAQGGSSGLMLDVCNTQPNNQSAIVTLEGAPRGVSISQPSNGQMPLFDCDQPRPQFIQPNFFVSVAQDAALGLEQPFFVVLEKDNQRIKLKASITIFTISATK